MVGREDRGGVRRGGADGGADAASVGRERVRDGAVAEAVAEPSVPEVRRGAGIAFGEAGVLDATDRTGAVDDVAAGGQAGGIKRRRRDRRRDGADDAEKNAIKPWLREQWVLPPEQDADFVCAMEDVLDVYQRPYDPKRPVVGLDEQSKQLIRETRTPVPAKPGRPARRDYEYERNGTVNLFMVFEPLGGRRRVTVTDRRTKLDFAEVIRNLIDVQYPTADKIVLVMDNLNTHKMASLYERFPAAEARRLIEKLEIHYTPKHGSWLNVAETELSVLTRQCLDRRIGDKGTVVREVAAWEKSRNEATSRVDWQFTTADARVKLKRLYPTIQAG